MIIGVCYSETSIRAVYCASVDTCWMSLCMCKMTRHSMIMRMTLLMLKMWRVDIDLYQL